MDVFNAYGFMDYLLKIVVASMKKIGIGGGRWMGTPTFITNYFALFEYSSMYLSYLLKCYNNLLKMRDVL